MTKPTIQICALVTLVQVLGLVPALRAQTQEKASTAAAETAPTAKVDVVLMRYQGDKKVSSLPFTLYAASNSATKLRMGLDVPLPQGGSSYQYRSIGTSIDCQVSPATAEGRYPVLITVNDSSVYAQQNEAAADLAGRPMTVRSFDLSNRIPMRDGQTIQFATATDKVSGEVLKMEVTLTIVK